MLQPHARRPSAALRRRAIATLALVLSTFCTTAAAQRSARPTAAPRTAPTRAPAARRAPATRSTAPARHSLRSAPKTRVPSKPPLPEKPPTSDAPRKPKLSKKELAEATRQMRSGRLQALTAGVRVEQVKLTPAVPRPGQTVSLAASVVNEGVLPAKQVQWRIQRHGKTLEKGSIAELGVGQREVIKHTLRVPRGKPHPGSDLSPARRRLTSGLPPMVFRLGPEPPPSVTGSAAEWSYWSVAAAIQVFPALSAGGKATCTRSGSVNGPVLTRLRLKTKFGIDALEAQLTALEAQGVPDEVARAMLGAIVEEYVAWVNGYRGTNLLAFVPLGLVPGHVGPPTPMPPYPVIAADARGLKRFKASALETKIERALGALAKEDGASDAIADFAQAAEWKWKAWLGLRVLTAVEGQGPVPVAPGPVVKGTVTANRCGVVL